MSQIQVDNIYNKEATGGPNFPLGVNVTGVVTATSFSGSGVNLTGVTATDVGTLSSLNVTGSVSIGGTLTYEDVTNIDSVGLITARAGIDASGGSAIHAATFDSNNADGVLINLQRSGTNKGFLGSGKNIADSTGGVDDIGLRSNANLIFTSGGGLERLRITSTGSVGIATAAPAGTLHVQGNQVGAIVAMAANDVDCSLGNYFTKTITGATTFTFSNAPAGVAFGFTMDVTLNGSNALTWPTAVKWNADTAPTLTDGKTQLFMFVTDDGGTRWRGSALVDYVN